ncbi:GNAT family N-acetyltransferase [Planctomonas psychrotolerans]|uniref:GNAT family N-acetyltransferase n=1 Tax=Planctomonas psychrotolerans TaxID=2528712 RepID=UPI00123A7486|nr:GNAT family N-acetyltransferase [Planctomonas psychrotolerans]
MQASSSVLVRVATQRDVDALASALAAAFQTDPVVSWLVPRDDERERRMPAVFRMLARRFHVVHGHCYVADLHGRTVGGAMWDPPERWKSSRASEVRALPELIRVMGGATVRSLTMTTAYERAHPEEPHFYLSDLGTRPELQGRGVGTALMRKALAEVDGRGMPAYLESSSEANVPFYERFGFGTVGEIRLPNGPVVPTMWRPARS